MDGLGCPEILSVFVVVVVGVDDLKRGREN